MNRWSYSVFNFAVSVVIISLITFGVLKAMEMPTGTFLDWLIGVLAFTWLMMIVVVPWNVYFEAKEVLSEAKTSEKRAIVFDNSNLPYLRNLAFWSLLIAIFLHLASAGGLYWIAWAQISTVGYAGAGAALLLTLLRPAVRAYQYISDRLYQIRQEIKYPREDVVLLKDNVELLLNDVKDLKFQFDYNESDAWASRQNFTNQELKQNLAKLSQTLQDNLNTLDKELNKFKHENDLAHEQLSREQKQAITSLNRDGKFVDNLIENLTELVRFIKRA
jgi:hypothetical protein